MLKNSLLRLIYFVIFLIQIVTSFTFFLLLIIPVWFLFGAEGSKRFFNVLLDALNSTLKKIPD